MNMVFNKFERGKDKYIQVVYKKDDEILDIELLLNRDNEFIEIAKSNITEYLYSISFDFKEELSNDEISDVLDYINQRRDTINNKIREYVSNNSNDKVILVKPIGKQSYVVIKSKDRYILTSVYKSSDNCIKTDILTEEELNEGVLIDICEEIAGSSYSENVFMQINETLFIGIMKKKKKFTLITYIEFQVEDQSIELFVDRVILVKKSEINVFDKGLTGIYGDKELRTDTQKLLKTFAVRYL